MKITEAIKREQKLSGRVVRILKLLVTLPNDEVFTTAELEKKLDVRNGYIHKISRSELLRDYRELIVMDGCRNVAWGNKEAIITLRSQLNENK